MTMIIGHRGGRDLWPENSLHGFEQLKALGVEGVEFDVHLTRAGELLVIHDALLERTTDRSGPVADLAPGENRGIRLKNSSDLYIPTLAEVLEVYADTTLELHVELKADAAGTPYEGLEERTVEELRRHGLAGQCMVTSFGERILHRLAQVAPEIPRLASLNHDHAEKLGGLEAALTRLSGLAEVIAIEKTLMRDASDTIRAMLPPERLGVWVPNTGDELRYWQAQPLRQLTTDRPDRAVAIRQETQ
ncbi:glycerophosphodiester phosphodiesterase family protein [Oceanibium sediminis]|uniref:glycerophosphodiester phosphodiesterase family protein n=1 Tax=Oceanibium sediminis TaxID=2026339 RepID=UPI000DD317E6|nr:glycerophosphodiester phosphodiesterase family protein [Oceanibium sediminis]